MNVMRVLLPIAALAMLGAAPSTVKLGVPRDISTLSQQERMTLPSSTKVTIGRITTTLGAVRKNHNALVASQQRVRALNPSNLRMLAGGDHRLMKTFGVAIQPSHGIRPNPLATPQSVPRVSTSGFAADYQQFCNSVSATVCLYYPAGVAWWGQDQSGNYQTVDPLITDSNVCTQEGGNIGTISNGYGQASGCVYTYPSAQNVNFLPPAGGFTTSGWCNPTPGNFNSQVDQHGAVRIADAGASGFYVTGGWAPSYVEGNTPNIEVFCFLQVKLKQ